MERFDVVVVGAGPAGSMTAHRLASGGASVLLLDRARFPRDKPCGGAVSARGLRELPVEIDRVVEQRVHTIEMGLGDGRSIERTSRRPILLMTQRRHLDSYLVECAAAVGVSFRDGMKVTDVTMETGGVSIDVDGRRISSAFVIGADGANGIVGRRLGLGQDHAFDVALEGNLAYPPGGEDRFLGRAVAEIGTTAGGYGWIFPKAGHLNVGVWGYATEGQRLRRQLAGLCERFALDPALLENLRGYRLPLRRPGSRLAHGRSLLVGDAAGLIDPISGDGMYEAFVSSRLAAEAVLDVLAGRAESLEPYGQAISRRLGPMAAASWDGKIAFDRYPRLTFALAGAPLVWGVVERILTGEISHPGAARGPVRAPLRLIEALARVVGAPGGGYRVEARAA